MTDRETKIHRRGVEAVVRPLPAPVNRSHAPGPAIEWTAVDDQLRRRSVGAPAARSVLLTVLGEYVLPLRDGVWQETLINALGVLGYKAQAARQALARSVTAGWLEAERHGRRSRVHLTKATAEMLRAGAERIYGFGEPWEWDGRWLLVVLRVPEQRRDVRHQVRTRLAWAGFGSLGGGLWITPHVEREDEVRGLSVNGSVAEVLSFRANLGSIGEPERVLATAWDLDAVAKAYGKFLERFGRLRPKTPEAVFRAQTLLVHEWRKFPFLDPDLPESMLSRNGPRKRAYQVFQQQHALWQETAPEYFRSLEAVGRSPAGGRSAA
jgi:phenylacetic acid degradation operon negative regulatory protein